MSMNLGGRLWYCDEGGEAKFPLYWTNAPRRLDFMAKESLDMASTQIVDVLERLPPRASRKWIVCSYLTDDPGRDVCGMFSFVVLVRVLH